MSNAWVVDFTNVTEGGVQPGEYVAKVKSITKEEGSNYPYLKWTLVILSGASKGLEINHITTLKPEGLFNLRNTLIACGLQVPKSAVKLDPAKLIGKTLGIEVVMKPSKDDPSREFANVKRVKPASDVKMAGGGGGSKANDVPANPPAVDDSDDTMIITDDML